MKFCDACGSPEANIGMGGAMVCRSCDPDVKAEMDRLRTKGQPVNAVHIAKRLYRDTHSSGHYLLRDIPQDLRDKAKHRGVDDGDSFRDVILKALHAYLR